MLKVVYKFKNFRFLGGGANYRLIFLALVVCGSGAFGFTAREWVASPAVARFEEACIHVRGAGPDELVISRAAAGREREIRAVVRVDGVTPCDRYANLGVAAYGDAQNFWHLSVVAPPAGSRPKPSFILGEMCWGVWHHETKRTVSGAPVRRTWETGRDYAFTLKVGNGEVRGTVTDMADGAVVFDERRVFPEDLATRTALRVSGRVSGTVRALETCATDAVPAAPARVYAFPANAPKVRGRATGFFHTEQTADGRWWVIDPAGAGFIVQGVDHVKYRGHYCRAADRFFYRDHNDAAYPTYDAWADETLGRLARWGFNLTGAGSDARLRARDFPYTVFLSFGTHVSDTNRFDDAFNITPLRGRPCTAFPNVFHPDFPAWCDYRLAQTLGGDPAAAARDPYLFGYFLDNEIAWWGWSGAENGGHACGLGVAALRKPRGHTAKIAFRDLLRERCGGDIAAFNTLFGTDVKDWDAALDLDALPWRAPEQTAAFLAYTRLVAETYFRVTTEAVRRADPNHLILGVRFAAPSRWAADPAVWEIAGRYCDIVTFNNYPWADLTRNVVLARQDAHVKVRAIWAQPDARSADRRLRRSATARQSRDCLRVAFLPNPPRPQTACSATAPKSHALAGMGVRSRSLRPRASLPRDVRVRSAFCSRSAARGRRRNTA